MALVITQTNVGSGDGSAKVVNYIGLSESDLTPAPLEMLEWADRSIHVEGTFNAGTLTIEGSNNGTSWVALTDPQGNALTFTVEKIEQVSEITRFIRPRVTAGAGVLLNIYIAVKRTSGMRT